MAQLRQYTVYQAENHQDGGRVVMCNICGRVIAELSGGERDANLIVARHALAHVARLERMG